MAETSRYVITVSEVTDAGATTRSRTVVISLEKLPELLEDRVWSATDYKLLRIIVELILGLRNKIHHTCDKPKPSTPTPTTNPS